jgi:acyl-coenzyme A thioesterase PaaI-like protein
LRSFVVGNKVVASFRPEASQSASPGVLSGGIIGTLLDCHCLWAGAWALMQSRRAATTPCMVTASYAIDLKRPTPMDAELTLEAWPLSVEGDRATIAGTLSTHGKVCATCHGTFVAVTLGHPAYHG